MAKKNPTPTECQNCGTKLTGDYCHACGQRADEPRRVVIGLVQDFLVDTLAIDGKLARSIFLLLTRPGRLARRYLDGKRVYYSPPFRLYLFASVFFFLAAFGMFEGGFFKVNPEDAVQIDPSDIEISDEAMRQIEKRDPEAAANLRALQEKASSEAAAAESDQEGAEEGAAEGEAGEKKDSSFKDMKWEEADYSGPDWFEPHARKMFEAGQRAVDDPRLFFAESRENLPRVLLLAPVIYALILLILYFYRRKYYVYDHLVISLYMHAALYAYLLISILLGFVPGFGKFLWLLPLAWGAIQPFAVFRQAYGSGWISTILKGTISLLLYFAALVVIVTFGLTYSLYNA